MVKIKSIEYFRVRPRWLFVKIEDVEGHSGWGEATLEGHTEAVEGTLNALIKRFVGYEAESVYHSPSRWEYWEAHRVVTVISSISGRPPGDWASTVVGRC